jgi:threonine dehydrogenase-like Zn-dependent dehydrogenase
MDEEELVLLGIRFRGNRTVEFVELPKPVAKGTNVVVEVKASALCGTDLPYYFAPTDELGYVPGHEIAGCVAEVDKASFVKVGDRVILNTQVGCGHCDECRRGRVLFCSEMKTAGVFGLDGGHSDYVLIPEKDCLPLPEGIPYDVASVIPDGLGVPYHCTQKLSVASLDAVVVFGLGPIGLGMVLFLKFLGSQVIAIEPNEYRRKLAKELGADFVIDPESTDVLRSILEITSGIGVDKAIDCSSSPITVGLALASVRKGGRVGLVGQKESQVTIQNYTRTIIHRELEVFSSCGYNLGEYGTLMRLVQRGLRVSKLITHRFPFREAPEAHKVFSEGNTGKVVLVH